MKKLLLIFGFIFSAVAFGQNLSLNTSNNFYEYSEVNNSDDNDLPTKFLNRFKELNLTDIIQDDENIRANGFTSHLVMGNFTVEIAYKVKVEFKENRYKLTITSFVMRDKNGANPLETLGMHKKRWIKNIDKQLPDIVSNLKNINNKENW